MSKKKIIILAGVGVVILGLVGYGIASGKFSANLGYSAAEQIPDSSPDGVKCADEAKAYFQKSPLSKDPSAQFLSRYNTKLQKCFIETTAVGKDITTKFIFDVVGGRTYARAYVPTAKTGSFSCMTGDKICLTQKDYDTYFNSIMRD